MSGYGLLHMRPAMAGAILRASKGDLCNPTRGPLMMFDLMAGKGAGYTSEIQARSHRASSSRRRYRRAAPRGVVRDV